VPEVDPQRAAREEARRVAKEADRPRLIAEAQARAAAEAARVDAERAAAEAAAAEAFVAQPTEPAGE
jgi:hypothetical protein